MTGAERWSAVMVDLLVDERRRGVVEFGRAWRHAAGYARAKGVRRPPDFYRPDRTDLDDPGWMPYSSFFREACRREWEGRAFGDWLSLPDMLADGGLSASTPPERGVDVNSRVSLIA